MTCCPYHSCPGDIGSGEATTLGIKVMFGMTHLRRQVHTIPNSCALCYESDDLS